MIKQHSIDNLKASIDIVDIIGRYISISKKGADYTACCPFHEEKSASFSISKSKQIFKCFGCGAGGDAIKFVMDFQKIAYPQAIEEIASLTNFQLEKDEKQPDPVAKEKKEIALETISKLAEKYQEQLAKNTDILNILQDRGLAFNPTIQEWQIGFAPNSWRTATDFYLNQNQLQVGIDLGIVKTKEKDKDVSHYDMFRNRIMIPIHNYNNQIVGFGGRAVSDDEKAKYINSNNSLIYAKDFVLFGMHKAKEHIAKYDMALITEGYFDVISAHQAGLKIAIAVCSKELTDNQAIQILKQTKNPILCLDNDGKTEKQTLSSIEKLLKHGADTVQVMEFPDAVKDLDDFCKAGYFTNMSDWSKEYCIDAPLWTAKQLASKIKNIKDKENAYDLVAKQIALYQSQMMQDDYIASTCKIFAEKKTKYLADKVKLQVSALNADTIVYADEDAAAKIPKGVDADFYMKNGYYPLRNGLSTGYYFNQGKGQEQVCVSNFIMEPLFHLFSLNSEENKRIVRTYNGIEEQVMEIRSDDVVSADAIKKVMARQGNFWFYGNNTHIMRINTVMGNSFPKCWELLRLGWQKEGFFAYANKVYHNGNMIDYDQLGIIKINDVFYYSPSCSDIYKNIRQDSDTYKNDREINFCQSPITLNQWMDLLENVYGKHARFGIAYCLVSIFRDLVFSIDNNCPHLYGYGQSRSGKSKFMESILAIFYKNINAYNLNSGTDSSFSAHMSKYSNCPAPFNEFDEATTKEDWFQIIKTAYDGEGRKRMSMTTRGKIEEQEVVSTLILIGQYLCTKDDNSILSRSILLSFANQKRTDKQIEDYNALKNYEEMGMNSLLLEFLKLREHFENKGYYNQFHETFSNIRSTLNNANKQFNERVARNYAALSACITLAAHNGITFPFSTKEFEDDCIEEVERISALIQNSDSLAIFWTRLQELVAEGEIKNGVDYKIREVTGTFKVTKDGKYSQVEYDEPRKVIFLRLKTHIHGKYMEKSRSVTGKPGMGYESIRHYLEKSEYYIGEKNAERFLNTVMGAKSTSTTSAMALNYDDLKTNGIDLDYAQDQLLEEDKIGPETQSITTPHKSIDDVPF